jgi:putative colanic acid biosynthesis UDP-glucose lipid carrier transferase
METEGRQVGSGLLKRHAHHVSLAQRVADGALIALTNWAAAWVYGQSWTHEYALATAIGVVFFYFVGGATGLYFSWRGAPLRAELRRALIAWGATVTALLLLAFAFKSSAVYSRVVIFAWLSVTPVCLGLWRVAVRSALKALRARGHNIRTVAIAGSTRAAVRVAEMLTKDRSLGFRLKAVYDDRTGKRRKVPETLAPHGGKLSDLVEHARAGAIDVVYMALPMRAEQRITETVRGLADTTATVYMVPDFHAYDLLHAQWGNLGEIPVVSIFDTPLNGLGGWAKRLEDMVLASLILVLVSVPMLVIAILIKLDSKGPVLFRQPRYGLNGKPISVWKFRSMRVMQTGSDVPQAKANLPRRAAPVLQRPARRHVRGGPPAARRGA